MRFSAASAALLLALPPFVSPPAAAGPISYLELARTGARLPSGSGSGASTGFDAPSMEGDRVVFVGRGRAAGDAIFLASGGTVRTLVGPSTPVPGGRPGETFRRFAGRVWIEGPHLAFTGFGDRGTIGVYAGRGGHLRVVADGSTPVPGDTRQSFTGYGLVPSTDDGKVVFEGAGSGGARGLYLERGGRLRVIVDTTTRMPGGAAATFTAVGAPAAGGGRVVFVGAGPHGAGLYTAGNGGVRKVADRATPVPGGLPGETFAGFAQSTSDPPAVGSGSVVFVAIGNRGTRGVYVERAGSLAVVADDRTRIPGGGGLFRTFLRTATDGGRAAFVGTDSALRRGLYSDLRGALVEVIAAGDDLNGREVHKIRFGPQGLSGDRLAFTVVFMDGSEAVFLADLGPSPRVASPLLYHWAVASLLVVGSLAGLLAVVAGPRRRPLRMAG
jgi:hypothetical protein